MSTKYIVDIETAARPGIMDTFYPIWAITKYPGKEGQELEDMAALHAEFGMICAVSFADAYTDAPPKVFTAGSVEEEAEMLKEVISLFDDTKNTLIGHNIKGFDIPFLAKRYIAQLRYLPNALNFAGKKPWDIPHKDTMEILRFGGGASMSLRSACLMFGIKDPKDSVCGSEVPRLFREGKLDTIGEYCAGDVIAIRELVHRLTEAMS